jgi:hypothetical protein
MKILSLKHARAAAVAVFLAAYGLVPDAAGLAQALSFGKAKSYTVGTNPVSVVAGDFNNDSKVDLAVVNNIINKVSILLGDGVGGFTQPFSSFPVGNSPLGAAVGKFNADGNLDLAVANFSDNTVTILLGNGDGTFTEAAGSPITVGTGPIFIAVGDFNGGGFLDLAVANFGNPNVKPLIPGNVTILMGNGDGTFTEAAGSPITVGIQPVSIAVGNFNNDVDLLHHPDLAVANFVDNSVSILLGNGDGTFTTPPHCDTTTPGTSPTCLVVGTEPVSIVTGDFNNDGVDDLAVASEVTKSVSILLGNAITTTGLFQAARNFNLGKIPVSLTVADFNGDGALDLAAAFSPDKLLSVILGNGDGTFGTPKTFKTVAGEFAVTNGDFDGDSKPDLAVVNGKISVLLNNTRFPGAAPSITVTAPNGGETLAIGATTNITWTSNDIPGSNVRIDLTRDSTATPIVWKTIVKSVTVATETKAWKVTGSATTHAQIRICAVEYPVICDTSDADFTIN